MKFELQLDLPGPVPPEEHADTVYDAELDDVRSILRDLCASLAQLPGVRFTMTVGGPLPVSVRRDLVVVMEQLGDVLGSLRNEGKATLDLYEQGIEEQLVFAATGDQMMIERRNLLGRPAPPYEVHFAREVVEESLRSLARTFVAVAKRRSPGRTSHTWFVEWAQALLGIANP